MTSLWLAVLLGAGQGSVVVSTFDQDSGLPASVLLSIDGIAHRTNEAGLLELALDEGPHTLSGTGVPATNFTVATEQTTEIMIRWSAYPSRTEVDVIQPPTQTESTTVSLGRLTGTVVSEAGKPVTGARVIVQGTDAEGVTDSGGKYDFPVPSGEHSVLVSATGFRTAKLGTVTISPHQTTEANTSLFPAAAQLDAVEVSVPKVAGGTSAMLNLRKASSAVSDVLGAEQMSKTGDSNAASALARVPGVTIIDGKFVVIRGMGDRYASVQLNGATLPSPNPERRVIPLDVFPAQVLEGIILQKTYTVDMPGQFGGGVVGLRTRGIPEEPTFDISASVGARTGTTLNDGLSYSGGNLDWLGFDDGTRSLPSALAQASEDQLVKEGDRFGRTGFTADELEAFGESLNRTWSTQARKPHPDLSLSVSGGDKFELLGTPIGYSAALSYKNGWQTQEGPLIFSQLDGANLVPQNSYQQIETQNEVKLGAFATVRAEISKTDTVTFTSLFVRNAEDSARVTEGYNGDVDTEILLTRLWLKSDSLITQQLQGHHVLLDEVFELDWSYTASLGLRDEPDRRELRYDFDRVTDSYLLSDRPEGNQRVFSKLRNWTHDLSVKTKWTLPFLTSLKTRLLAGAQVVLTSRDVETRRYKFQDGGPAIQDPAIRSAPGEQAFSPENIGPNGFRFEETTRPTDNYTGSQRTYGAYAALQLHPIDSVEIIGGIRAEFIDQSVETFSLFEANAPPVVASNDALNLLPSLAVNWEFISDWKLRAAVARTVIQPEFRELSPALFNPVTGGRAVVGNPDLGPSQLTHADLRVEWYPSADELISIGGFFKYFQNPIETSLEPGAQWINSWRNGDSGTNLGLEFEVRKNLNFIHSTTRDFFIASNVALVRSQIKTSEDGLDGNRTRPLEGQSSYAVNAVAGWDNPDYGFVTVSYNVIGDRIRAFGASVAGSRLPDSIEISRHQLDVNLGWNLPGGFSLSASAGNLLDPPTARTESVLDTASYTKGRTFSLGLGAEF